MFRPESGKKNVFISYAKEDRPLADRIAAALQRIDMNPYVAERVRNAGKALSEKISEAILGSLHFVTIMTIESYNNQWVNQELGYAYSLKFLNNLQQNEITLSRFPLLKLAVKNVVVPFNPIEIYPIIERGTQLRGFLDDKSVEYIPLTSSSERETILSLLSQIRDKTVNIYHETLQLKVECKYCETRFYGEIPTQEQVEFIIPKERVFSYECPHCGNVNLVEPYTFSTLRHRVRPQWS